MSDSTDHGFVGREAQLVALDGVLTRAIAGEGSVSFVTGEPGAGKSALVSEFARRAQAKHDDLLYAVGRCDGHNGQGDPFLPFREVLDVFTGDVQSRVDEGAISTENARRVTAVLRSTAKTVFEFGPALIDIFVPGAEIATRLGGGIARKLGWKGEEAGKASSFGEGFEQEHVQEQFANVLRTMATERPLLIILDDLHWADSASLSMLFHLGRRLVAPPVLFVGTYRSQDVAIGRNGARHPLEPIVNELRRELGENEVALDPVGDDERRRFTDQLLDAQPNELDETFRAQFFQHTHGTPLFGVELLRSLKERGALVRGSDDLWRVESEVDWTDVPARVEGVIAERVARLGEQARRALRTASVEGQQFTAQVVSQVEGRELRRTVSNLGEIARTHGLIRSLGHEQVGSTRIWRYGFSHVLIQEYLYDELDPAERGLLHADVAEALLSLYGDTHDEISGSLARHFEEAGAPLRAAVQRERAGDRARASSANAEAADHYRHGLELLASLTESAAGDEDARQMGVRLRIALGEVETLRGEYGAARDAFEDVLAVPSLPRVQLARAHRGLGESWQGQHERARTLDALHHALETLGESPDDEDDEEEAGWRNEWIETNLALLWVNYWRNRPEEMIRIATFLEPAIEAHGSTQQHARLLRGLGALAFRRCRYLVGEDELTRLEEAVRATNRTGNLPEMCEARFLLGFAYLWADRPDEARRHLEEALELTSRVGFGLFRMLSLTYLAVVDRKDGLVPAAEAHAQESRAAAEDGENPGYVAVANANLAWVAWRRGEVDAAERLARAAVDVWEAGVGLSYPFQILGRWPLVELARTRGDLEGALDQVRVILGSDQKRLAPALESTLSTAVSSWEDGNADAAISALASASEVAAERGYA